MDRGISVSVVRSGPAEAGQRVISQCADEAEFIS
jgi:hypothetical protein